MFNNLEYKRIEADRRMSENEERLIADFGFLLLNGVGRGITNLLFGNRKKRKSLSKQVNELKTAEVKLAKLNRRHKRRKSIAGSLLATGVFAVAGFFLTKKVIEK